MKNAHEKAIEIATALMASSIRSNGYGKAVSEADEMAKFFLKLESAIAAGLEKLPD